MEHISLSAGFPPASEAEWLALVGKALGSAPFNTLRTKLHEGLITEPLYTQAREGHRFPVHAVGMWCSLLPAPERSLLTILATGQAHFPSISMQAWPSRMRKISNICLAPISHIIFSRDRRSQTLHWWSRRTEKSGIAGSAGFDPLTTFAVRGERPAEESALFADYLDAAFYIREHSPSFVPFLASGLAWECAGGSAVQELAFTLAAGTSYWRALAGAGMPLAEGAACIGFQLAASADIFLTIAKFRAMRLLWARALEAAGEAPRADLLLLAKMSQRILTAYDPHVNLLRGTAAAFGAAIGGATGIEVLPFDSLAGGAHGSLPAHGAQYEPHSATGKLSFGRSRRRCGICLCRSAHG